jgi:hypothetical protein
MKRTKLNPVWRNAMVTAINEGLQRKLFGLKPGENFWTDLHAVYRFEVGDIPAIASIHNVGFDELGFHVAMWLTADAKRWIVCANAGHSAGEMFATGYLERREGTYLQTPSGYSNWNYKCRLARRATVERIAVQPMGYDDRGRYRL